MASKKKVKIESQLTDQIAGMMESGCTASDIVAVFDSLIQKKADAMKVADMGLIESRDIKVASKQLLADRRRYSMLDSNAVIRAYLAANAGIAALVGVRVLLSEASRGAILPAVSLFTRGGITNPHIDTLLCPSVQIDCWAGDPIGARGVYRAVYDCLQGLQDATQVIGATTYYIKSAIEEVQGQDIVDNEIQGYFKVLSFWQFMIH